MNLVRSTLHKLCLTASSDHGLVKAFGTSEFFPYEFYIIPSSKSSQCLIAILYIFYKEKLQSKFDVLFGI